MDDSVKESKFRLLTVQTDEDVHLLRKKSQRVSFVVADNSGKSVMMPEDRELLTALRAYVLENDGLGMSAVQLGVHKSMFVMRKPWNSNNIITIINPKFKRGIGKSKKIEGCFSFPTLADLGAYPLIERYSQIWVDFENEDGEVFKDEFMIGLDARIWQHEYDHCNGILMVDSKGFKGWAR